MFDEFPYSVIPSPLALRGIYNGCACTGSEYKTPEVFDPPDKEASAYLNIEIFIIAEL